LSVVLDADVVIGALDASDAYHPLAAERFLTWEEASTARLLSAVTLTEVLVGPATEPTVLRGARRAIAALGIAVHAPNEAIAVEAARLRGRHPISLPDAYLLATARQLKSQPVSFDRNVQRAAEAEGLA